jgi:hypothetical protein
MALLEFDLDPVEKIDPWGLPDNPRLSWFALTLGRFRMPVGDQVLFRYRAAVISQFEDGSSRDAHYHIASIARDILGSVTPGVTPLPPFFEFLASNRELMECLSSPPGEDESDSDFDLHYAAWRWLGERSPWTGYFVANPDFHFIRIGERLHIRWDNRGKYISELEAWDAPYGSYEISVEEFLAECRDFSNRLLIEMDDRISQIEAGTLTPQIPVSTGSLRNEHENWHREFESYFCRKHPDIPWDEAEDAIRKIAAMRGIPLSENAQ